MQRIDTVLIVDDEMPIRELLRDMLATAGIRSVQARGVKDAVAALPEQDVQLVIADLHLADGDGADLLRHIRGRDADLPVIICTGDYDIHTATQVIDEGANGYLLKPLEMSNVLRVVRQHLDFYWAKRNAQRQQKELQEALDQAQQLMEDKKRLTDMIVHDLKNPLTVIMARMEMLDLEQLQPRQKRHVSLARSAAQDMMNMILDMLDVSRFESSEAETESIMVEPLDLNRFLPRVHSSWRPVVEHDGGSLVLDIPEPVPEVFAESSYVARIMGNLITNAISHASGTQITLGARRVQSTVVLTVADEGPGIPAEWHERIFDMYAQIRQGGRKGGNRGLGLVFCRHAVEVMGGKIWVESKQGQGTQFHFSLPLAGRSLLEEDDVGGNQETAGGDASVREAPPSSGMGLAAAG